MDVAQGADAGVKELLELATTLRIFISCVERYPLDAVAGAVAARAKAPLAQTTEFCVRGVLDEFQAAAATGNLVSLLSAVWFTREFCETSTSARQLVRQYGGMELLGPALLAPQADDRLIEEAARLLHYLQGCQGLLEVIPQVLQSDYRIVAKLLWQLRIACRENWSEIRELPPASLVRVVMNTIEAFPTEWHVHEAALALLSDLLATVEYRTAFGECGGWSHVLLVLESQHGEVAVHRRGLQILCELQRGGAGGGEHSKRCKQAVLMTLEAFHSDENVLEWGLWLLLELGGLPQVLQIVGRAETTSVVGVACLQALRLVRWGQTEAADVGIVPAVVRSLGPVVIHATQIGAAHALTLSVETLLDVGCLAAPVPEETAPPELIQAQEGVVELTLEALRQNMQDASLVRQCLQIVRLFQAAREGSSLQRQVRDGLLGGPQPDLLQRLVESHASQGNDDVHREVLWVQSVLLGPGAIVRMMESLSSSLSCAVAGVKILGQFFGEYDEVNEASRAARPTGVQAITASMGRWSQETHLITHACYALSSFALHGVDAAPGSYNYQHLQYGLQVTWKLAVPLADELDRSEVVQTRMKARYLRQEVARLEMESVKAAAEPVRQELRSEALRIGVAATQCRTLVRDAQAGLVGDCDLAECLRLALVVLGVLGQAEPTVQVLQEGGPLALPLALGAAEAAVDLCRLGMRAELLGAGLAEAARCVRNGWQNAGNHLEQESVDVLAALQFAEDWVVQ